MGADEPEDTETLVTFQGVVLPPPDALREYGPQLQAWAQGRQIPSYLDAILRRLSFGEPHRAELLEGVNAVVLVRPSASLADALPELPAAAQGSVAQMLVVQGLHQLMVLRLQPGAPPPEFAGNLAMLRALERVLPESGPDTEGLKLLRRYRRSLHKRDLVAEASVDDGDTGSLVGSPAASDPPTAEVSPPPERAIAPPTLAEQMKAAAAQAARRTATRDGAASRPRINLTAALGGALVLVALVGAIQWVTMGGGTQVSLPKDIDELPVISMVRHPDTVILKVPDSWIRSPAPDRVGASEELFARLAAESGGEVVRLVLQGPTGAPVGTVTASGAQFVD